MDFKAELDRREYGYRNLEEKCLGKKALEVTEPMWSNLNEVWHFVARRNRMWLWKLDAGLPGKLGKCGNWINEGEEILEQKPEDVQDRHDHAQQLAKLLQESVVCYYKKKPQRKLYEILSSSLRYWHKSNNHLHSVKLLIQSHIQLKFLKFQAEITFIL